MHAKLGVDADVPGGDDVIGDLLALMAEQRVDYTMCLRALSSVVRGDADAARSLFADPEAFDAWTTRWWRWSATTATRSPSGWMA